MSAQLNGQPASATAPDARFRDLIAQAPVAMSVLRGPDFVVETANAAMLRIVGRGEEIIGQPALASFPEVATQGVWKMMQGVYHSGQPLRLDEAAITLAQGNGPQEGFYNISYTPLLEEGGAVTGILQMVTDVTEQVRARRAAEESKARFGAAIGAVQGILWTNDAAGKMIGEQPGWAALTGQAFEDYQGYGWTSAVHPDDAQPTVDAWEEAVRERKTFVFEHRVRRADGSWGQYSIRAIPLMEEGGAIREWVGVHTDITEQRRAEGELKYRQALLEAQNEAIPDAILIVDTRGGMISFNRHFAEVWGIPEEITAAKDDAAALEYAMTQLVDPQAFIEGVNYCYAFPDEAHDHTEILFKDGRTIERWGNAVTGTDGTRYGWAWYFRDVTAQKRVERELHLKDRAIAASNNGIIITGADLPDSGSAGSPIVYVNPAFVRMTGYPEEEIVGQDCRFLQAGDRDQPEIDQLREAIRNAEPCTVVLRNYKKDGTLFYNELSISPVVDDGKLMHFVGVQSDITERIATDEALRKSEQRFRSVFNGQFLFLAILAPDGTVMDINELPLKAVGAPREEVIGKIFWDTAWWRDLPGMRAAWPLRLEQAAGSDGPVFTEDLFQTESGEARIADAAVTAVRDATGAVEFFIVQASDITERKKAEEDLRASEDRYQSFVRQSSEGIWRFEISEPVPVDLPIAEQLDLIFQHAYLAECNDAMAQMYGYAAAEELHGARISDFMPRDAESEAYLTHFITSGYRVSAVESRDRDREGDDRYFTNNLLGIIEGGKIQRAWGTQRDITEQRAAEVQLRDSEAQFRSLIEEAPVATCLFVGRELRVEVANEAILSLWGKGADALGKPLAEALPELQGQPFLQILDDVFTTGEAYHSTAAPATIVRNGVPGTYYFDFTYKPLRNATGEVYAIMNMAVDVTEQVMVQRRVEESQQQLLSLFEESPVGIAIIRADGPLTFEMANPFYGRLVGRTPEEIVGKPLLEALPELVGQGFDDLLRGVIQTGTAYLANEVPASLKRGDSTETVFVDLAYQPRTDANGVVNGILVVATDVTGQVVARRQVEEREAYFRRLTDNVPAIIWITETDGSCSFLNKNWYDYTGQSQEEAEGFGWLDATHPDDKERTGQLFVEANDAHKPFSALYRLRHHSGEYRWAVDSGQPKFADDGTYEGMIGTVVDVHEQQLAEEKTRAGEARFRSVIEAAPVAIGLFVGRDLVIESPNQTFIDIVGKGWDVVGKPLREAMPELLTEGQPFLKILDDVFTTGVAFESPGSQVKILRGGVMTDNYYNITYKPLLDKKGEVYAILDVALDVTAQVMAQQRVERSEENLRSLVESAPFPIGVFAGRELRIALVNQAIIDIWGKGPDIVGKTFTEVLPEFEGQGIVEQLQAVYDTGVPLHITNQRVDIEVDGAVHSGYYNYSFTPLFDATGAVMGVMNTGANITDLAVAKQQVEEAGASLRSAVELAELGTWEIDLVSGTLVFSERLQEWFGLDAAETTIGAAYNPIHERDRDRVAAAVARAQEPGSGGTYDEEYTLVAQNTGRERVVHAQGKTFFDGTGKAVRMSGTAQDVTKQRALQAELERQVQERTAELDAAARNLTRSNEELSQYAYVASHDLQEPLRKIQMFSGILNGQKELPETARGTVARISGAAERMSTLIQSLLEFSRLQKTDVMTRPVDLSVVAREVVQDFELMIEEHSAAVEVGELPVVEGVGLQMNQLFYNLIGNALKFARPDVVPEVRIFARTISAEEIAARLDGPATSARYHHIKVTDNGIGFEVRYTEQIFEVFKRLHGRDAYPGSGIGLALCRRIVANHGGVLYAESEVGKGSTFNILLPEARHDSP